MSGAPLHVSGAIPRREEVSDRCLLPTTCSTWWTWRGDYQPQFPGTRNQKICFQGIGISFQGLGIGWQFLNRWAARAELSDAVRDLPQVVRELPQIRPRSCGSSRSSPFDHKLRDSQHVHSVAKSARISHPSICPLLYKSPTRKKLHDDAKSFRILRAGRGDFIDSRTGGFHRLASVSAPPTGGVLLTRRTGRRSVSRVAGWGPLRFDMSPEEGGGPGTNADRREE